MRRSVDAWGRVVFQNADDAVELLMRGYELDNVLIEPDSNIDHYNQLCLRHNKDGYLIRPPIMPYESPEIAASNRQSHWWMPDRYRVLDVRAMLVTRCQRQVEIDRVVMEMDLFEDRRLLPMLRLMCFLVDRWRDTGVVWGVGRGSSVASYCLFLIGVHKLDSLYYNLDIREFLRD